MYVVFDGTEGTCYQKVKVYLLKYFVEINANVLKHDSLIILGCVK